MPVGSNVSKMASSGTRPTERLCSSKIPPISRSQFGCALRCPSHSFCLFVKKGAPGKRKRTSPRTKSRGLTRDLINKGDNGGRAPENAAAPTTRRPSASQSLCFSRNFLLGLASRPAWRFAGALKRRVERRALAMQAQASIERLFDRVQLIPNVCGRRVVRSNHDKPPLNLPSGRRHRRKRRGDARLAIHALVQHSLQRGELIRLPCRSDQQFQNGLPFFSIPVHRRVQIHARKQRVNDAEAFGRLKAFQRQPHRRLQVVYEAFCLRVAS